MIVLHAAQLGHEFFVWGETDTPEATASAAPEALPPQLPFGASHEALAAALRTVLGQDLPDDTARALRTAWVPSVDGTPVASTPLIAPPPASETPAALQPWTVPVLRLKAERLVELLALAIDRQSLAPGVAAGRDLGFWANALRFASALVTRQHMLPGLDRRGDRWHACWNAVVHGDEADRLGLLARTMPSVCHAMTAGTDAPPPASRAPVLRAFVDAMVDHLVRAQPPQAAPTSAPDSMHERWLRALIAPDGTMEGDAEALEALAGQIRDWRRPIDLVSAAPLRLVFRLEEPPAEARGSRSRAKPAKRPSTRAVSASGQWYVRFLLQPVNDPRLLLDVAAAWSDRSRKLDALAGQDFNLKEFVLASLVQAAGVCAGVETSLQSPVPGGFVLDAAGAFQFLTEQAWGLEQAGFTVMLPAWWTPRGTKLRLTARAAVKSPKTQPAGGVSLDTLLRFDWEITLGKTAITAAELQRLAQLKVPLVRIRGQWVQVSAEQIEAAVALARRKAGRTMPLRDVIRMALGAAGGGSDLEFAGVRADGWAGQVLAQLEGRVRLQALNPPAGLAGTLRPYQVRGVSWLAFLTRWGLGACLADDMGLGKTIQVLALVQRNWEAGNRTPVLLIAPTSVTGNWQREAARFTPGLPVLLHHGSARARGEAFAAAAAEHALVLSSYALLTRDSALLASVNWGGVVLDEAQNIKNPETRQAKAARALTAGLRIALTGTPVENHVGDLWSIMDFLNPGFLGSESTFRRRFFVPIQINRDPEAADQLKRLTGPFVLRRLKSDRQVIADLPEKMEMKVFCPLTSEQASLYAAVVKEATEAIEQAEGIQRKGIVLATLTRLKQVCNHPAHFLGDGSNIPGRSGKVARLTEMLEEVIEEGDRALVFTQFTEMGELLRKHLQDTFAREVLFLHGAVPKPERDRMVQRFQRAADAPPIFLLSLKAGGTGLNLTRANHVFHFDRWWNPAVENQATDRAFRIGQSRRVQVHKFLCQGTLEERIDQMIESKQAISADVVGTGESWLTELSSAELKDLFTLRAEAIQE
jgi:superfamily II DNA or RNA helicase